MRSLLLKCIIILILALSPIAAQATGGVTADAVYWQREDGLYVVDATFHNNRVSAVYNYVTIQAPKVTQAWAPSGWDVQNITLRSTGWIVSDAQHMLEPENSLSGVMFTQATMLPSYSWNIEGSEGNDVGDFTSVFVPEPASLLALAVGTAGLLIRKRRHNP